MLSDMPTHEQYIEHDDSPVTCGRCGKELPECDAEVCWWCTGYMCYECWDRYGHCGHKEAEVHVRKAIVRNMLPFRAQDYPAVYVRRWTETPPC